MPSIGERIRDARIQRGMTQSELGSDLVTPSMISQIEANKARPSFQLLTAIANRLGLPVEHFMGELDHQFTVGTQLRLAEYYLQIHDPQSAVAILSNIHTDGQQGYNHQERSMHLARARRLLGEYIEAAELLEELRETAYRGQDEALQFLVSKESGHIEYDIGNANGAMHEWKKALSIGEGLLANGAFAQIKLRGEMAEICTSLHALCNNLGNQIEAARYLERAADFCAPISGLRAVAEALVQDAVMSLANNDPSEGKNALDQAISIVEAAERVEQHILINVRLSAYDQNRMIDPWIQAAVSTATVQPQVFLDAEIERINRLLKNHQTEPAHDLIERANTILYHQMESEQSRSTTMKQQVDLEMAKARLVAMQGDLDTAIAILQQLGDRLLVLQLNPFVIQVWAQLMDFLVQRESYDEVSALAEKMEDLSHLIIQTRRSLI